MESILLIFLKLLPFLSGRKKGGKKGREEEKKEGREGKEDREKGEKLSIITFYTK